MSMAERKTQSCAVKNPVKRKLTRAEKKEIAAVIQAAKGDGKPHTAQQTIPYLQMYPDGICRVTEKKYSKSLVFEDINYQLAQADDKTAIFENWCDFLNYFDASVSVQLSFINQGTQRGEAEKAINIPAQDDAFNSIRTEYGDMLKNQLSKGNNGLVKHKYITFSIEADNLAAAKSRLARIETDVLNNFKVLGAAAGVLRCVGGDENEARVLASCRRADRFLADLQLSGLFRKADEIEQFIHRLPSPFPFLRRRSRGWPCPARARARGICAPA